jgi:hypothetical protein
MGTQLILATFALAQTNMIAPIVSPNTIAPVVAASPVSQAVEPNPQLPCNAGPWQRLRGRTVSDLLTISLPKGTRIFRVDDPPSGPIASGRLSIEINRSTRVRRVYCS